MISKKIKKRGRPEILLVDDTPAGLQFLAGILTNNGYVVRPASSGALALRSVEARVPDLILLDVKMPDMDGYETCRRLKTDEHCRDVPVIFISAHGETTEKVEGFTVGGVDYITKPFNTEEVLARVGTHIRLRELTEKLEQKVRERTEELTTANQQLQREIAARKKAEEENTAHIYFLESLERIERAIRRATDMEQMLWNVMKTVYSIFQCDRAWLLYPCDPEAPTFQVPVEVTDPDYPGAHKLNLDVPMKPGADAVSAVVLAAEGPVPYGPETAHPVYPELTEQFGVLSQMVMAIYPKTGKPWMFGMHQCSHARVWTDGEQRLFNEIGRRLADGLSSMLIMRELSASESKLRSVVEAAAGVILCLSPDHKVMEFNPEAERLYGRKRADVLGKDYLQMFVPENLRDAVAKDIKKVLAGEPTRDFENPIITDDGSKRILSWSVNRLTGRDGEVTGIIAVGLDVTERKQVEEEILKLSLSMEQSPALVVITDLKGNIEYVNRKFTEVTGYSLEEVKGKNPRIFKSGETPREEYQRLWDAIAKGKEWRGEFHNRKKNGELYWESALISPIKNEKGEITHYAAVKEDVTEIKQLQQQLLQSQKMESIGTLAGGIAHDFNNLLTVINGYAERLMMKLKKDNPLYSEILPIKQAGEKAASLTRQLLAFSRKQVHTLKILDLNDVITGLQKMVRRLIGEDISIEMILKPGIAPIKADPGQIEQTVINLIVNARDAINERTGITSEKRITIETGQVVLDESYVSDHIGSHPGLHAVISVSDSGIGMDDELKGKIFEPFFTTKEKGKGTGLGLSTVYGIVKQNQGSIFVYSEWGHGTTIKILWPASEQEPMKGDVHLEKHVPGGTETILLVEDDPGVRNFTSGSLLGLGYVVHEASNGEEAIRLLKDKNLRVDLLLSDIVMPKMGGKELYEKLKVENPAIRILLTSGYTDKHIIRGGELMEGLNFLQKPYSHQVLARMFWEILDA